MPITHGVAGGKGRLKMTTSHLRPPTPERGHADEAVRDRQPPSFALALCQAERLLGQFGCGPHLTSVEVKRPLPKQEGNEPLGPAELFAKLARSVVGLPGS